MAGIAPPNTASCRTDATKPLLTRELIDSLVEDTIAQVLPEPVVRTALCDASFPGRVILVAIGKAAWRMAKAALEELGPSIDKGIIVTKYGHIEGELDPVVCREAGHPIPDHNSYASSQDVLDLVKGLSSSDTVLFLVSGGGSALFEVPAVSEETVEMANVALLERGASIQEANAVRKRLSKVKAGRFAEACAPARVLQIVLSDVVGDRLDVIASGPATPDETTTEEALSLLEKYAIELSAEELLVFSEETPKHLDNVETVIGGGVGTLCLAASSACAAQGFAPTVLATDMCGEASEAGRAFARRAISAQKTLAQKDHTGAASTDMSDAQANPSAGLASTRLPLSDKPGLGQAIIIGGETVVHVHGTGLGGRNQEFALAAAEVLSGTRGIVILSFGSDGTDGPTDAAGGVVDGTTWSAISQAGVDPAFALANNDAYHALDAAGALIVTGPTGTNVNDVAIALIAS